MLAINFSPFPNLETERLFLRRVDVKDVNEIIALRSNPETMKYIPRPLVKTIEDALEHIAMMDAKIENNEGINWAITQKGNPKLIGVIGHYRIKPEHYRAEIGYMLLPEYHGKGIIAEAIKDNKTLTALILGENQIGDIGAMHIRDALKDNNTLTTLSLFGNKIGDVGAMYISEAVLIANKITTLNLGNNKIGDAGAMYIIDALKVNHTLTYLKIWPNEISQNLFKEIDLLVEKNKNIIK